MADAGLKQPWLFRSRDEAAPTGTCAIITTTPTALVAPIHDRMPVVLSANAWGAWLEPRPTDPSVLAPLLQPLPANLMTSVPVSPRMNSPRVDDEGCWLPVEPHIEEQGELF